MASDLATALLSGNASPLAADPVTMQVLPQLTLAQSMMQSGLSGAPAYPAQALGRLAQALVGSNMMHEATNDISNVYGRAAESMAKVFPAGTPIGDMLRSPDTYVRMQGLQMAGKAALVNSEYKPLSPEQQLVAPSAQGGPGVRVGQGSPELAEDVEGRKARVKAPYETGGEGTVPGGPSGVQRVPITAAEREQEARRRAAPPVVNSPVNPLSVNGQPQNLTGPIIPPGGTNAARPAVPQAVPPTPPGAPPPGAILQGPNQPGFTPVPPRDAPPAAAGPAHSDPSFDERFNVPRELPPGARVVQTVAPPGVPHGGISGVPVETPEYKADLAAAEKIGGAKGGVIAEQIEAGGKNARDRMNALDTIESAMRTNDSKGVVTGPQAESVLRFKQLLDGMGIKTDWVKAGMPQSEMIQKMNAQLASASIKAMSPRPTQFEFATFQKNNPGLANSREGTLALIDVLRQTTQQDMDLGRLAQDPANQKNWPQKVEEYYAQHGLRNPFTGRPMREEIEAARGHGAANPAGATATASGGPGGGEPHGGGWITHPSGWQVREVPQNGR